MISIIIPIQRNNEIRDKNFELCLESVNNQSYEDNELIVVEQEYNGKAYYDDDFCNQHIVINDKKERGFNLSWCRNVGAKVAHGDIILLMDSDLIISKDYLEKVSQMQDDFASGSNQYKMTSKQNTELYYQYKHTHVFNLDTLRFTGYSKKRNMGYGLILIFKKEFWDRFGGFSENFFNYGYEDREASNRILSLLDKDEDNIERIDSPVYHLHHNGRNMDNNKINRKIYEKLINVDVKKRCELFKKGGGSQPYVVDLEKL